ncbi:MAG: DUF2165 family protein [Pseudomonadota bacterium]
MDLATMIAQMFVTACLAGWMSLGVKDNIQHPVMNRTFTTMVLEMERMAEMYPEHYALVAHRRITNPTLQTVLFRGIVLAELIASLLLWVGAGWLGLAILGTADAENARVAALVGTIAFTGVWASFLIGGNHFSYWYCHEWAQNNHFQLVLWGTATMVLLVAPS